MFSDVLELNVLYLEFQSWHLFGYRPSFLVESINQIYDLAYMFCCQTYAKSMVTLKTKAKPEKSRFSLPLPNA